MFFEDHEKKIYTPSFIEGSDQKFDPLAIDRSLKIATGNKLSQLVDLWKAVDDDLGDISEQGVKQKVVLSCQAEECLAAAARAAFGLPQFPECTDGTALEYLCDYLDWIKKKGMPESTSPVCTTSAVTAIGLEAMRSS